MDNRPLTEAEKWGLRVMCRNPGLISTANVSQSVVDVLVAHGYVKAGLGGPVVTEAGRAYDMSYP